MARVKDLVRGIGELPAWVAVAGVATAAVLLGGKDLRRVAKRAVGGYLAARDKVQSWSANVVEDWQDLCAEAEAEYRAEAMTTRPAKNGAGREEPILPRQEAPLGWR